MRLDTATASINFPPLFSKMFGSRNTKIGLAVCILGSGLVVLTLGREGAVLLKSGEELARVPAFEVQVVDTTGAGDLYAAGFLYGYTRGMAPTACGKVGAIAAGEIISHFGARPEASLADLVAKAL